MPYPNEHACRLEDPKKYDTCRRGERIADKPDSVKGKKYYVIYCKKEGGSMEQQAFRYPIKTWTESQARSHCNYNDGSFEAAESESKNNDSIEIRTFKAEIKKEGEEKPKIKGTAAVFDQLSEDLGGFREIIRKKAFTEAMQSDEIYGLKNHNEDLVLGRTKSKTLSLSEDDIGLGFVIDPPNTTYANDLIVSMERGDMDKCSFAFVVDDESVKWYKKDGVLIRDISKMKELWDVSIVTYPAFPQTQAYLFNKRIKTPEQVYREYRSKLQPEPEPKQERLTLARNKLKIYEKLIGGK